MALLPTLLKIKSSPTGNTGTNMKKIFLLSVLTLVVLSCSGDDGTSSELNPGDGQGGSLATFALKGNYLYSVDNQKLNIFSLINGPTPVQVNNIQVGFRIETLFAQDNYLFIGSQTGMYIYSLQNPENPTLLSNAQHFTACDPVVSNGANTFVTLHSGSRCGGTLNVLEVYDTSDLNNPLLLTTLNLIAPKGLGLYGHYLLVCDEVIKIFDVADPTAPILVKSLNVACHDVIVKGNDLFAIGEEGLYRYELNPAVITDISLKSSLTF